MGSCRSIGKKPEDHVIQPIKTNANASPNVIKSNVPRQIPTQNTKPMVLPPRLVNNNPQNQYPAQKNTQPAGTAQVKSGKGAPLQIQKQVPTQIVTGTVPRQIVTGTVPRQIVTGTVPRQVVTGTVPRQIVTGTVPRQIVTGTVPISYPIHYSRGPKPRAKSSGSGFFSSIWSLFSDPYDVDPYYPGGYGGVGIDYGDGGTDYGRGAYSYGGDGTDNGGGGGIDYRGGGGIDYGGGGGIDYGGGGGNDFGGGGHDCGGGGGNDNGGGHHHD